jgi:hypothetical protein
MTLRVAFYKGTRPGLPGGYNYLVRRKERGPYSHCEFIFSDDKSASSSFEDGGVRFKDITYDSARWDIFEMPKHVDERAARQWFVDHIDDRYDLMGNVYQLFGFFRPTPGRVFCSAALAAAAGIADPWRFGPNALACVFRAMSYQLAQ